MASAIYVAAPYYQPETASSLTLPTYILRLGSGSMYAAGTASQGRPRRTRFSRLPHCSPRFPPTVGEWIFYDTERKKLRHAPSGWKDDVVVDS